ncbi:hypothetical protein IHE45_04G180500 [Dioscorea alata]|uniref:Uncharacterized protein n=1 Tax=Dioscorea alata TaxID=55571 RepID=A0ACB7WIZ0_DIOAL|nr:hypothetical protein IHE45_04G180500 [Dioscorea alata]
MSGSLLLLPWREGNHGCSSSTPAATFAALVMDFSALGSDYHQRQVPNDPYFAKHSHDASSYQSTTVRDYYFSSPSMASTSCLRPVPAWLHLPPLLNWHRIPPITCTSTTRTNQMT